MNVEIGTKLELNSRAVPFLCPNLYTGRFQYENKVNALVSENDHFCQEINVDQRRGLFSAHF
jgi:hypothetical protein